MLNQKSIEFTVNLKCSFISSVFPKIPWRFPVPRNHITFIMVILWRLYWIVLNCIIIWRKMLYGLYYYLYLCNVVNKKRYMIIIFFHELYHHIPTYHHYIPICRVAWGDATNFRPPVTRWPVVTSESSIEDGAGAIFVADPMYCWHDIYIYTHIIQDVYIYIYTHTCMCIYIYICIYIIIYI